MSRDGCCISIRVFSIRCYGERNSAAVSAFFSEPPSTQLAVSQWTRVEIISALAREVRAGALPAEDADEAIMRFGDVVRRAFVEYVPDQADFEIAAR